MSGSCSDKLRPQAAHCHCEGVGRGTSCGEQLRCRRRHSVRLNLKFKINLKHESQRAGGGVAGPRRAGCLDPSPSACRGPSRSRTPRLLPLRAGPVLSRTRPRARSPPPCARRRSPAAAAGPIQARSGPGGAGRRCRRRRGRCLAGRSARRRRSAASCPPPPPQCRSPSAGRAAPQSAASAGAAGRRTTEGIRDPRAPVGRLWRGGAAGRRRQSRALVR